jgi:hypothetical protein
MKMKKNNEMEYIRREKRLKGGRSLKIYYSFPSRYLQPMTFS